MEERQVPQLGKKYIGIKSRNNHSLTILLTTQENLFSTANKNKHLFNMLVRALLKIKLSTPTQTKIITTINNFYTRTLN